MSAPIDNGGPAFPHLQEGWTHSGAPGLSIRDYFAAKAMHALMTEPSWGDGNSSMVHAWAKDSRTKPGSPERYALVAYAIADAMLQAREQ
jgi:hypothetical protein